MALDKQAAISFNKYCPYACCLRTLFVDVSTARLFPKEAVASEPHLKCLHLDVYHWRSSAGGNPDRHCVRRGSALEEEIL